MKKLIFSAMISLGMVSYGFASTPSLAFNGAYIGGGFTYSSGKIKDKISSLSSSARGLGFNGFTGYGTIFGDGLYLGGELGLGYDGSNFRNKVVASRGYSWKSNSKMVYSFAVRVGYVISDVLTFMKMGFEGRSTVQLKDSNGNQVQMGGKNVSLKRNGVILGGGVDYALTKNVFIRAEYLHNFGSKSSYFDNNTKVADLRIPSDTILIGAGYRF